MGLRSGHQTLAIKEKERRRPYRGAGSEPFAFCFPVNSVLHGQRLRPYKGAGVALCLLVVAGGPPLGVVVVLCAVMLLMCALVMVTP